MQEQPSAPIHNTNLKILVTGAAGLVGHELIQQLLLMNVPVKAMVHHTEISITHPLLEIIQADILDVMALEEIMQDVSHVYHCAAIVSFDPKDQEKMMHINREGTANVVNACIDAGVQKLLYVSSVAALGRIREGQTINEKMHWTEETSNSIYGKSKYLAEMEVWRGIGEGLPAVIVNPTVIIGAADWDTGSAAIFKTAYNEFKWYSEGVSGFVDVRDVCRAMILLMNSKIISERFILNGWNVPYREIFTLIAACFHKKPPYKKVSPALAGLIWRLEAARSMITGKKHLLTKETAHTAQAKVYFDNSKVLNALPGFHFTPLKESIEYTCAELKKRYQL